VLITVLATTLRVLAGLALAAVASLAVGVAARYWTCSATSLCRRSGCSHRCHLLPGCLW
jgi:hypothetical protein